MTFGGCYLRDDLNIENMPLKSVRIEGMQRDLLVNLEITQIFSHSKPTDQQVSYIFPNDQKFCIYDVTFVVGKEIIKPSIKSKEEAKKIYDEAVSQGKKLFTVRMSEIRCLNSSLATYHPISNARLF